MSPPPGAAPAGDAGGPFWLTVDDVFSIRGRGTVVTGRIVSGTVRTGDDIRIDGARAAVVTRCRGIEMFRKRVDTATVGDTVGLPLDIGKDEVATGDVVSHLDP
jgi:elongation factor Tu